LIAKELTGAKCRHAQKWNTPIVKKAWILACHSQCSTNNFIHLTALLDPCLYSFEAEGKEEEMLGKEIRDEIGDDKNHFTFLDTCVIYIGDDLDSNLHQVKQKVRTSGGTLSKGIDGFVTHILVQKKTLSQPYF
jgi:hypothetical protein